jgi:hypothetical protein
VLLAAVVCAGGLGAVGAAAPAPEALGFVSRDGARFVLDGAPFYVTGANQVRLDSLALACAVVLTGPPGLSCWTRERTRIALASYAPLLSKRAPKQYNLMTYASYGPSQKAQVLAVLVRSAAALLARESCREHRPHSSLPPPTRQDDARNLGINVIRTWAFCDGQRSGAAQPSAGEFDERVLRGLDFVLASAQARQIRLLLTLTNYWDDFGGIQQYVEWARASGDTSAGYKEGARCLLTRSYETPL